MAQYSHSKLSTFENCPLRFKYRYIDKIVPEVEISIEAHLGKTVHDSLEWLYTKVMQKEIPPLDKIIEYYSDKWQETWKPGIVIVNKTLTDKDYFEKGVRFLLDYYQKHSPFKDNTLEVEKKISLNLDEHRIIGFIDRLVYNKEKDEYEVHDYKTANNLPFKESVEKDRQLALYAIAVKELYGKEKEVALIWHYLAHNQKITSRRTNEQLEKLKRDILKLIREIESTTHFPPYVSKLCDWCEYKSICKAWNKVEEQRRLF